MRRSIRRGARRAFNLVELLIALAISSALLSAVMVALDASFSAYQQTTEVASTHTVSRLVMHRMLTLIRSGTEFGPVPDNPRDALVASSYIEFTMADGEVMTIEWREDSEQLWIEIGGEEYLLLEGVVAQIDPDTGDPIMPFTLEFENGYTLHRATIDMAVVPDDNLATEVDAGVTDAIRLVASAMPRGTTY